MKEIPATQCLRCKIDDDISLSCSVVVDIDHDGNENIVFGSNNGTINVINLDGSSSTIQPLKSMGRLSAICSNEKYLFAASIDGKLFVISCKDVQGMPGYTHKLEVEKSQDVCKNCCTMCICKNGKEYCILGTEEGGIYIYELDLTRLTLVTRIDLDGSVVSITCDSCNSGQLHLFVSCEGECGYELEFISNILSSNPKKAPNCKMNDYLIHKTWVYPSFTFCSCSNIIKSISVTVAEKKMTVALMSDNSIILFDSKGEQYKVDIRDNILDLNAFSIVTYENKPEIILVCRDLFFFHIYTDILRYFKTSSFVCYL